MVFRDKHGNGREVNTFATSEKYFVARNRGLCAISIFSNVKPQLCKQLQCKVKCNMLQQAVVLLLSNFWYLNL